MHILEIIARKKRNCVLSPAELTYVVNGFTSHAIPDYQMSAFLMAVWFNGLNAKETAALTQAMMATGEVLDLSSLGYVVDKHSTGGVGDKVTLVLTPLIAALGARVVKMSGRGLGFTGGTVDKLESIPGMKLVFETKQVLAQAKHLGLVQMEQSERLVPADKLIYALRDVSGTVDSLPLIASSIMSKKLATGANAILLDVKCGSGAFMKDLASAKALGQAMIDLGQELRRDVRVEITSMTEPLGNTIGNKNEVLEALATLSGNGPADLRAVVLSSAATMLVQAHLFNDEELALQAAEKALASGAALAKFAEVIKAQGGDWTALTSATFWTPAHQLVVKAKTSGYLRIFDAAQFGEVAVDLGAGRRTKGAQIDFEAGINLLHKTGAKVTKGTPLFELYSSAPIAPERVQALEQAFTIEPKPVTPPPLILAKMK